MNDVVVRKDAPAALPAQQYTFADMERMAKAVAASKLFGVQTPEAALSLMMLAQAEGRHPAQAARDYHILDTPQGPRPSLKADTMLARFQEAGGRVEWHELTNQRCCATFSHPVGGSVKIEWTWEDAERAKLPKQGDRGPNNWFKYPRAMLRSRVVSEGVRTVLPSVIVGIYTPEELSDGDVEIRDVTPRGETPAPAEPPAETVRVAGATVDTATGEVVDAEVVEAARMDESRLADCLTALREAEDSETLSKLYRDAYAAAKAVNDKAALKQIVAAKDARKAALAGGAP